jgi:ribosomal 30S subunit maturation factor RimM
MTPIKSESHLGRIIQIDSDPAPNGKQVVVIQIELPESVLVPFADFVLKQIQLTITK